MIPQPNRPRSGMYQSSSLQLDRPQNLPLHSSWNTLPLGSQVKFVKEVELLYNQPCFYNTLFFTLRLEVQVRRSHRLIH